jgi:ribonuclease HI
MEITIFTDGASKGNPGPGGWGGIVATEEKVEELGGGEKRTTNNRMELMAVIEALKHVRTIKPESVTIYSDSAYVINGATKWVHGWKRNGWKTKEKKDVLNKDLWEQLAQVIAAHKNIVWQKVGGHVDIPGNDRADAIATSFAENKNVHLFNGPRSAYKIDLTKIEHDDAAHAKRSAARTRSNQKAYSYVSKVDGNILVHKTWEECKQRVEGKQARFKKALSAENQAAIIKEFSG